jgi:hypothetical protein
MKKYRCLELSELPAAIAFGDVTLNTFANDVYEAMVKADIVSSLDGFFKLCAENDEAPRADDFTVYAQEYAYELGMVGGDYDIWPLRCIDWDLAASQLAEDYTPFEFNGNTFYVLLP